MTGATAIAANAGRRAGTAPAAGLDNAVSLLAALSWLAALIHATVVPEHWAEYRPFGGAFAVLAAAQFAWSAAVFRAPGRRILLAGAVLSAGVGAVWALSRTTGLPVGPEAGEPEAVGPADVAASAAEAFLAVVAVRLARATRPDALPGWVLRLGVAVLVAGGVALTVAGHHH